LEFDIITWFDYQNTKILNMLNARYILAGTQRESVLRNPYARGNAWFVRHIEKVNSPDEEIAALAKADLKTEAVIDQSRFDIPFTTGTDSTASVTLTEYEPDYLKYESSNGKEGLAVFSEVFYPVGWKVSIDGKPSPQLRANYVLRALMIPAGNHTIEFAFRPDSYYIGDKITYVTSLIFGIMFFIGMYKIYKEIKPVPEEREV